jgi:hypothetical protein
LCVKRMLSNISGLCQGYSEGAEAEGSRADLAHSEVCELGYREDEIVEFEKTGLFS